MEKTSIMIVEDQILVSTNIRLLLKFNGYDIFNIVTTAEEALSALEHEQPDLVLMDIMLPGKMDGIECADQIIKRWNLPVIFLTARTDAQTIQRAKKTDAYGYLTKDIQLKDQLPILVEFVLYKHRMEQLKSQAEQEIKEREEKFRTIVSSARDAIIFLEDDSQISFWNKAAQDIFGFSEKEVTGNSITEIMAPNIYKEKFSELFSDFDDTEQEKFKGSFELEAFTKDNNTVPVEVSLSPVTLSGNNCACAIIRDITDRKKSEEELQTLVEEIRVSRDIIEQNANDVITLNLKLSESEDKLKELNASKDKFFSIIAHDLKGPFQGLMGYSEVLSKDIEALSKSEIKEFATDLHTSAKQLFRLLENLLQWTRIQRGVIECSPTDIKVSQLAAMSIDLVSFNANQKKITIENNIPQDIHAYSDINMINTVFRNLISNAVKFTHPGGKITLNGRSAEDKVIIDVADNGIGIPESDLDKLFKIDAHHTTQGTNNEKGTGLGLILCKDLIEKNKGEIKVESVPGEGTKFIFSLPQYNGQEAPDQA